MTVINLTPHKISFFGESQFINLKSINPTAWVADGVDGDAITEYESAGVARISTSTLPINGVEGLPAVRTTYGELQGIPDVSGDDFLVVSLPTLSAAHASGHPLADQMASPYKVVRLASDTSVVLGAIGLSFQ
jgi:hypothetical protein